MTRLEPQTPGSLISIARIALKAGVICWGLLAVSTLFLMTLATDEAWVLNGVRSLLAPQVEHLSTDLIATSGGPFTIVNLLIELVAGNRVWVHRLPSLVCLALTFLLVVRRASADRQARSSVWLMLAVLVSVPGTAEIGTAALGTSMGMLLIFASMSAWTSPRLGVAQRVLVGGLLYGLAAASRFELILFGPAVLLVGCAVITDSGRLRIRWNLPAIVFTGVGLGIFVLNQWLMSLPANATKVADIAITTGIGGWALDYPRLLNQWFTLTTFAPLSLLALAVAGAIYSMPTGSNESLSGVASMECLLAATGTILLAAWIFRAPIPHLRYVFPALFCFAVLGAIGMRRALLWCLDSGSARHLLLCYFVGLACVFGALGTTLRSIVMADSDYASWEWSHEMAYDYFRRFDAGPKQAELAAYVRDEIAPDARVYSYVPYALRYLTNRPIVPVDQVNAPGADVAHAKRYLVLTPAIGTYLYPLPTTFEWLRTHAILVKQVDRFSVYQLPAGTDDDLKNLQVARSNYVGHPNSNPWFGRK